MGHQKNHKYAKFCRILFWAMTVVFLGGLIVNPFTCIYKMKPIENPSAYTLFRSEEFLLVLISLWFVIGLVIALLNTYLCNCKKA